MQQHNLDTVFNFILNKKYRWCYHILFWLIIFSVDLVSIYQMSTSGISIPVLIIFFTEMVVVYTNIYFLFNKFLVKGKILYYCGYTLLTIIAYLSINHFMFYDSSTVEYISEKTGEKHSLFISVIGILIAYSFRIFSVIGTAVGITFFKRYFIEQKSLNAIKQDSLENELLYLKNQINPHFLFNALNNIYVLSKKNLPTTSDSILLLSNLLRYQLYDCARKDVQLSSEIDYVKNFMKLEKLRKINNDISLTINGDTLHVMVSPFIFMPFIENAIKYSGLTDKPKIDIQFHIEQNKIVFLITNNKIDIVTNDKHSGIGLNNVKRRLFLLYENSHELLINEDQNTFNARLILNI